LKLFDIPLKVGGEWGGGRGGGGRREGGREGRRGASQNMEFL